MDTESLVPAEHQPGGAFQNCATTASGRERIFAGNPTQGADKYSIPVVSKIHVGRGPDSFPTYRGLAQVSSWVRLKFATMNLKKLARWKARWLFHRFFVT